MPPRARAAAKTTRTRKPAEPLPNEDVEAARAVINGPEQPAPPDLDDSDRPIPAALKFTSDDEDQTEVSDADVLEFEVDGTVLYAIKPSSEQWGVLMALLSGAATVADRVHAMQQFAVHVLDDASYLYVQNRLLDRNDKFGSKTYGKMLDGLIEAFSPTPNRAERRRLARDSRQ